MKLLVSVILILSSIGFIFSGMLMQIKYHMHHAEVWETVWGWELASWQLTHKVFAVIGLVFVTFHMLLRYELLKAIINRKLFKKYRHVIIITTLFCLTSITGLISWGIDLFSLPMDIEQQHLRKMFTEIHDKITIAMSIALIIHFKIHFSWILKQFKSHKITQVAVSRNPSRV